MTHSEKQKEVMSSPMAQEIGTSASETLPSTKAISLGRWSPHSLFVAASWAFVILFVLMYLLINYGPQTLRNWNNFRFLVFNAFNILPALMTAMMGAIYARRFSRGTYDYYGWVLLGLAGLAFAIGGTIWGYYELFANFETPFPSWADAGYLSAAALLIAGVFVLFGTLPVVGRLRLLLDSAIAMTSVAAFLWYTLIERWWYQSDLLLFARLIGIAYPMADIIALYGACAIFLGVRQHVVQRRSVAYLVGGIICIALSDSGFTYYSLYGSYSTGMWVDFGWAVGWTLIANAIRLQIARRSQGTVSPHEYSKGLKASQQMQKAVSVGRLLMPYVAGALAIAAIAIYDYGHNGVIALSILGWGTSLLILVALRQVFTLLENQQLTQQFASLLEYTKELNDVLDAEHVLGVTARYARQLTDAEAAAAWLISKNNPPSLHTERRTTPSLSEDQCDVRGTMRGEIRGVKLYVHSGQGDSLQGLHALASLKASSPNANFSRSQSVETESAMETKGETELDCEELGGATFPSLPEYSHCVPLAHRGETIGYLAVARSSTEFSVVNCNVLESIALEAGTAISNALSYRNAVEAADCDPVTGLLNHRAIHERLRIEWERASQKELPLSVVMIDLNDFKFFNDTYGHPVGDQVLQSVARVLRETCRNTDVLARYGGDEFALILPDTDSEGGRIVAQRVKERMDREGFRLAGGADTVPVGLALGVATFPHDARTRNELLAAADANLYRAKLDKEPIGFTSQVQRSNSELRTDASFGFLDALVTAVDNKDSYTRRHSEDVTDYALWIAEEIGLSQDSLRAIRIGGLLHDVGKIGVPDEILRKPGKLSNEEFDVIKRHPTLGALIVAGVPGMNFIVEIVRSHHERWDGRGYPDGLCGEEIPLLGRIVAVADAFSAMTTTRPYRRGMSWDDALAEVEKHRGTQFDPQLADAFLRVAHQRLEEKRREEHGNTEL